MPSFDIYDPAQPQQRELIHLEKVMQILQESKHILTRTEVEHSQAPSDHAAFMAARASVNDAFTRVRAMRDTRLSALRNSA